MNNYEALIVAMLAVAFGFIWWLAFHPDPTAPLHAVGAIVPVIAVILGLVAVGRFWRPA
jgi:hypothetical protein